MTEAMGRSLFGTLFGAFTAKPQDVAAAGEVPPVLKERHDNFEGIGDAFKAVRGELDKDAPEFVVDAEAHHAEVASA